MIPQEIKELICSLNSLRGIYAASGVYLEKTWGKDNIGHANAGKICKEIHSIKQDVARNRLLAARDMGRNK